MRSPSSRGWAAPACRALLPFALVLLSSALYTGPGSLPLLVVAGIVFFLYRSGRLRTLRPRTAEPSDTPPTIVPSIPAAMAR